MKKILFSLLISTICLSTRCMKPMEIESNIESNKVTEEEQKRILKLLREKSELNANDLICCQVIKTFLNEGKLLGEITQTLI